MTNLRGAGEAMKPETSCLNTKALVDYVRARAPENLHLLWKPLYGHIAEGEDPEEFLSDANNWISAEVCRDIMEQARIATSDHMAVYNAGFDSIVNRKLGYVQQIFVRALFTPKHAIRNAAKINDKFNKTKTVEIVEAGNAHALVRLHWFGHLPLTQDFCLMNKGIYRAMSTVWDLPPAKLEENVCFFEGGPYCEYEMWWEKKSLWKLLFRRSSVKREVLHSLMEELEHDKNVIRTKYEEVTKLNVELEKKIAYLMSLQDASQAVVSILDEQSLIRTIMNLLTTVVNFKRAILFLVDEKRQKLRFAQADGAVDELVQRLQGYEISLDRMSNILVRVAATGRPAFVRDVRKSDLRKENIILHTFQPDNFAAAPLIARNKVIGVLAGELPHDRRESTEPDLNLLMAFSNQIAIAIENARLYRDLERSYVSSLQSQKMEAVGNLAGGIAHDFNNILQAVLGNVSLLLFDFDEGSPHYLKLKQIEKSAERATGLVRQLLTFSRKGESQPRPLDLNLEIEEVKKLLSSTIPKMIDIELQLDPELRMIDADPVQVNQVLMNLTVNARDAMPEGGRLTIGTKNVVLDEEFCRTHTGLKPGGHVMLWLTDTGHGIEKGAMDNIFEPFFTTKGPGQGTGLGLSTVYGIVRAHNGHIKCESERGVGTTFKVYLRALVKTDLALAEERGEDLIVTQGAETILLVDDEAGTIEYGKELLQGYGYTVLTARSGEEALEVFAGKNKDVDLVILDLIMSGMGGKRCLEEIVKVNPKAKILITTGYADSDLVQQTLKAGASDILNKPFRAHEMAQIIRRVLDKDSISNETTYRKRVSELRIVR
jgi:signal transduction histidine kinase/FixJ family two-component response regulator